VGTFERPTWHSQAWPEWRRIHKKVKPQTQAVWLDDWLARDAAEWAKEHTGIVWYSHRAFGQKVAEISGLRLYDDSKDSAEALAEKGDRSIICSIKAYGTGKNLQYAFHKNLIAEQPHDAAAWEQLIGRTHRHGQPKDTVEVWLYQHTQEVRQGFDRALELAEYVEQTTPNRQKLCFATYSFPVKRNAIPHTASKDQD
jgi:hypothetical protein